MHVIDKHVIRLEDPFSDGDLILALGGGGEGTIGRLRGRQVVALDLRPGELEEAPDGPIKIIGDATDLPFLDEAFDAAAAFFFLMYVPSEKKQQVFAEVHRVLRPDGKLHVWDVSIPPKGADDEKELFVIPLRIELPGGTVDTGYGTQWEGRVQDLSSIRSLAEAAGFSVVDESIDGDSFHTVFQKHG